MNEKRHIEDIYPTPDLSHDAKKSNIVHEGDLIIEGDVEENTTIHVRNGSLTILGEVKEGATIELSISKEFMKFDPIIYGKTFSYDYAVSHNEYEGNVSIDDRLYSNDGVTELGKGKFKITPASGENALSASQIATAELFFASLGKRITRNKVESVPGLATAIIDDVKYQGKEIEVKGSDVFVDGKKVGDLALQMKLKKIKEGRTLLIHGDVGHSVTIRSDAKIEIKGNVYNFCQIKSSCANLKAKNIGKETKIDVAGSIVVADVDVRCTLKSQAKIKALSLRSEVTAQAMQGIKVLEDIDDNCTIETSGHFKASTIGHQVTISTKDDIYFGYVGNSSSFITTGGSINGHEVGKNAELRARELVQLDKIETAAKIKGCKKVKIKEVGSESNIEAKDKIIARIVGDLCKFVCNGSVRANQLGSKVDITAKDTITIVEPMIHFDGSLKSKVVKMDTFMYSLSQTLGKITEAAITGKQGFFASSKKSKQKNGAEQCCPITGKKMEKSVLCTLDGKMYEDSAIRYWLSKYGKSPINRLLLGNLSIDDVLVANDELEVNSRPE